MIRVDRPHRDSLAGSYCSVRKSSWYTDEPEYQQSIYSPMHLKIPHEYRNQYYQKRGSATSLVEAVSLRATNHVACVNTWVQCGESRCFGVMVAQSFKNSHSILI